MSQCPVAHGYDPLGSETLRDPFPALKELRGEGPVFYVPQLDHYLVTRYEDIERVLLDRETWSAANASAPIVPPCPAAQAVLDQGYKRVPTLNNADPPRHAPMRRSVAACMTPRRLNSLEPTLRTYAEGLFDQLAQADTIDFVDAFAFPFPGYAAFSLLGFPDSDTEQLKNWSRTRVLLTYGRLSEAEQVEVAGHIVDMWRYMEAFVAERSRELADDLTSDLIRLSRKPDQLNTFDIVNIVYSMALAGHETTCNTIGNLLVALLSNRSQFEALIADPSRIPNAVEEGLRFEGPVISQRRIAKVDTEIGGMPLPKGSRVMLCFASGGRDESVFGDADVFDVERDNAELHLAFGKGPHLCLGAPLARLEARIALELLISRTPHIDLVPGQDFVHIPNALFRGITEIMVAPKGLVSVG